MNSEQINLQELVQKAWFAHSTEIPIHLPKSISNHDYYYLMRPHKNEICIVNFEDPLNPETAKLFRYTELEVYCGAADLEKDIPTLVGKDVVAYLQKYIHRKQD